MPVSKAKPRSRGRPPSREKHRKIMQAATDLFTRNGFEGTSVDDIAAAAGVSKQTVYSHFGCKETLFGKAVSTKCKQSGVDPELVDPASPPEVMLPLIAHRFLQLVTSPEAMRVYALCTVNADSHPELGRLFFRHGPEETVDVVADYLAAQARAGKLAIDNPRFAAWQFLCMLKAEAHMRVQFNLERLPKARHDAYIEDCVAMFLRAYAAPESVGAAGKSPRRKSASPAT
jgi:AcrR family transcriptional regulator